MAHIHILMAPGRLVEMLGGKRFIICETSLYRKTCLFAINGLF